MAAPPPATGARMSWEQLPRGVRAAVERRLGAAVVAAETQPAGFSPGLAARLRTADGRRLFLRAAGPIPNRQTPAMHRREARIATALPPAAPVPRLLWAHDEGEGGWVALAFDDVVGRMPAQPWRADELDRVVAALVDLSTALTPSPVPRSLAGDAGPAVFGQPWWRQLHDVPPPGLDAWSRRHAAALATAEERAAAAVAGETLLHLDLRADNLLLTAERVVVVDWPHARIGATWVDVACFAPSVAMQGGPDPEDLLWRHPAARTADPDAVTAAVVALAGYFTHGALQPSPPGLPTLRAFQATQGAVARRWVARRTGWD